MLFHEKNIVLRTPNDHKNALFKNKHCQSLIFFILLYFDTDFVISQFYSETCPNQKKTKHLLKPLNNILMYFEHGETGHFQDTSNCYKGISTRFE